MSTLVGWLLNRTSTPPHPQSAGVFRLLSLPDELVRSILSFANSPSLHQTAAVSRLCFELATDTLLRRYGIAFDDSEGGMACKTSEALCALRLALALPSASQWQRRQQPKTLDYTPTSEMATSHDVKRIERVLRHFGRNLRRVSLDFRTDILARPLGWRMSIVVPELLHALCMHSRYAAFIVNDGVATYPVDRLRLWNPHEQEAYAVRKLHDGGQMHEVPTIRAITTLQAIYPASPSSSSASSPHPHSPWTVILVNAPTITSLTLRLPLKQHEWECILSELMLPNLRVIEVLETVAIAPSTVVGFLNRHRLEAITYLPYASEAPASHKEDDAGTVPSRRTQVLVQPALERLRARAHFVDFALSHWHDPDEQQLQHSAACFPNLKHVELWPSSQAVTCLPAHSESAATAALRVLSSSAPSLTSLTLHSFDAYSIHLPCTDSNNEQWPRMPVVFPHVRSLTLTNLKCGSGSHSHSNSNVEEARTTTLAKLLETSFPALRRLVVTFRHSGWQSGTASVSESSSSWTKAFARWSWSRNNARRRDVRVQEGNSSEETNPSLSLSPKDWVRILAARNPQIVEYVLDGESVQV